MDRERIVQIIFGENGIVFSENDLDYTKRTDDLSFYFEKYPSFKKYWQSFLASKIYDHVYLPMTKKKINSLWTNNNSESLNNRLKQVADWKQYKLPDLIEKISVVSKMQLMDLRRALHGVGNFVLADKSKKHLVDTEVWQGKTVHEKDSLFLKFLNYKKANPFPDLKFATASNLDYKCPIPKGNAGKKPGQRRRAKAERTRDQH